MYPWYDSWWLADYVRAREILARRPDTLARFVRAMRVLQAPPDFEVPVLDEVFGPTTLEEIRALFAALTPDQLSFEDVRAFGRFIVRNVPLLDGLHRALVPLVSRHAGEPVEPTYNFASLYGAPGVCHPHMDAPHAKWTLDVCISQSAPWPIAFSQVVPWPEPGDWPQPEGAAFHAAVKASPDLRFTSIALEPGQAVLFSGSSQWHYRDPMPPAPGRQFCDLLFFHFVPAGTRELVAAAHWSRIFDAPELEGLGDPSIEFV